MMSEFESRLVAFCELSLSWCNEQTEAAIIEVHSILGLLLEESKRISTISKESVDAVGKIREVIDVLAKEKDRCKANECVAFLQKISEHHQEVSDLTVPILETLQFQDRVTQKVNNLKQIIRYWHQLKMLPKNQRPDVDTIGNTLFSWANTEEEKSVVKAYFSNVEMAEQSSESISFF